MNTQFSLRGRSGMVKALRQKLSILSYISLHLLPIFFLVQELDK